MLSTITLFPLYPRTPLKFISMMCLVLSTNMCIHRFLGFNSAGASARPIYRAKKTNIWGEDLNSFDESILNMQAIDYDNNMENINDGSQAGHRSRLSTRSARDTMLNVQEVDYYIDNIDVELLPAKTYAKAEKKIVKLPQSPSQAPTYKGRTLEKNYIIPGHANPERKPNKLPQSPSQASTYISKIFEQYDIISDYAQPESKSDKLTQLPNQAPTHIARVLEQKDIGITNSNDTVMDDRSWELNDPVKITFINDTFILNQHLNDLVDNHGTLKDEPKAESPIIPVMSSFGYGLKRLGKGILSLLQLL